MSSFLFYDGLVFFHPAGGREFVLLDLGREGVIGLNPFAHGESVLALSPAWTRSDLERDSFVGWIPEPGSDNSAGRDVPDLIKSKARLPIPTPFSVSSSRINSPDAVPSQYSTGRLFLSRIGRLSALTRFETKSVAG
jgi:hypothetical protein